MSIPGRGRTARLISGSIVALLEAPSIMTGASSRTPHQPQSSGARRRVRRRQRGEHGEARRGSIPRVIGETMRLALGSWSAE